MAEKHLILGLLWILFCTMHSGLAAISFKKWMAQQMGRQYKHYRLFYTLFAFVTLGLVLYYQITMVSPTLYTSTIFTQLLGGVIALAGLVIMGICIKKYFLSLSGLKSLVQDHPTHNLMINGIHRFVRHPLYTGTFMAIWGLFIFLPLLSLLIANVVITGYTLLGIELEEKKLEAEFGRDYQQYKREVPKLFPLLRAPLQKPLSSPK